jgi:hypothetical protein
LAADETLPHTEAVMLLLAVGAGLVRGTQVECGAGYQGGGRSLFEIKEPLGKIGRPIAGSTAVVDVLEHENGEPEISRAQKWYFHPAGKGWARSGDQCTTHMETATKELYQQELRKFLKELRINKLADRQGKPVELPLGLKE